jgi:hypothetical protein
MPGRITLSLTILVTITGAAPASHLPTATWNIISGSNQQPIRRFESVNGCLAAQYQPRRMTVTWRGWSHEQRAEIDYWALYELRAASRRSQDAREGSAVNHFEKQACSFHL